MPPTVGRIVHYVNADGEHRAAVISRVWSATCVNLAVLTEHVDGVSWVKLTSVQFSETPEPNTWHWPERAE